MLRGLLTLPVNIPVIARALRLLDIDFPSLVCVKCVQSSVPNELLMDETFRAMRPSPPVNSPKERSPTAFLPRCGQGASSLPSLTDSVINETCLSRSVDFWDCRYAIHGLFILLFSRTQNTLRASSHFFPQGRDDVSYTPPDCRFSYRAHRCACTCQYCNSRFRSRSSD